ncbi:FG-GAP repeat domain-containing protein [Streptomyces sp. NPDC056480]|uniref:FG-GAP repeat domain-containing protein n=1 Tax=Streptomyces sp. NPDC056480 TaxID=3345833 RepID=UPI003685D102
MPLPLRPTRPTRRALAVAAGTVLAVTAGVALTPPAVAAPTTVSAPAAADATGQLLPLRGILAGTGTSGYLTREDLGREGVHFRWVRYSDGAATLIPNDYTVRHLNGSDSVVSEDRVSATIRDMTTGAVVRTVPNSALYQESVLGAVGSTLLSLSTDGTTGFQKLHVYRPDATTLATGLPSDATRVAVGTVKGGTVAVGYEVGRVRYNAVLDLATSTVSSAERSSFPLNAWAGDQSETTRAWQANNHTPLVIEDLKSGARSSVDLGNTYRPVVRALGDWVLFADARTFYEPSPVQSLRGRTVAGEEVRLLDTVTKAVDEPDGSLLVQGGTLADGQGLYRIRIGADGRPEATRIASNDKPVKLTIGPSKIPAVLDLDKHRTGVNLDWPLSRLNAEVTVTLRHQRTGTARTTVIHPSSNDYVAENLLRFAWDGTLDGGGRAFNGAYDWQVTATPQDRLGPAATASGSFTVVRKANASDLTDNGSPDLIVRNNGNLDRLDLTHSSAMPGFGTVRTEIGYAWSIYDRVETTRNIAGSALPDLVARDKKGDLWLYQGNNEGGYDGRSRIGGGWQVYDQIAAGSDLNRDGRPDLVATDKAGALWLYKGTGVAKAPFASRTRIGHGWNAYDRIAATGNIGGDPSGDLVARDRSGVLWLYLGRGDGTFAARTKIGGGWNAYTDVTSVADANGNGVDDLVGINGLGDARLYLGTGYWTAPYTRPQELRGGDYDDTLLG